MSDKKYALRWFTTSSSGEGVVPQLFDEHEMAVMRPLLDSLYPVICACFVDMNGKGFEECPKPSRAYLNPSS